jgi:hypothetical protein
VRREAAGARSSSRLSLRAFAVGRSQYSRHACATESMIGDRGSAAIRTQVGCGAGAAGDGLALLSGIDDQPVARAFDGRCMFHQIRACDFKISQNALEQARRVVGITRERLPGPAAYTAGTPPSRSATNVDGSFALVWLWASQAPQGLPAPWQAVASAPPALPSPAQLRLHIQGPAPQPRTASLASDARRISRLPSPGA